VPLSGLADPGRWLAAIGHRKAGRRALARLEELFRAAAPPQDIAEEFGLDLTKTKAIERLASAPDGWRPLPAIITEKDRKKASAALLSLCRKGLVRLSPMRDAIWLSDAGRYILILCSAGGRSPREYLPAPGISTGDAPAGPVSAGGESAAGDSGTFEPDDAPRDSGASEQDDAVGAHGPADGDDATRDSGAPEQDDAPAGPDTPSA
jgi:hypothetical protein